jgi:hypothetical protein
MNQLLASIFHITDLHLFVDENGDARPPGELEMMVRFSRWAARQDPLQVVKRVVDGFSAANMTALTELRRRLPQLIAGERQQAPNVPIIVVQTGDVETFGRSELRASRSTDPYPAFAFLRTVLWPEVMKSGATAVIDMYGNHDVWSGTWPLVTPIAHVRNALERIATISGLGGPWPDRHDFQAPSGYQLEIYRVNTVAPYPLRNSLSNGEVGGHPPSAKLPLTNSHDVFAELFARSRRPPEAPPKRTIRIAAMHHPPHFFRGSVFKRVAGGLLLDGVGLARCLDYSHFQLVLAGHRHELDPARHTTHDGREPAPNQAPLNSCTGQLVSESPTATPDSAATVTRNSFALYHLFADDQTDTVTVQRTLLRYRDANADFEASALEQVFQNLPIH